MRHLVKNLARDESGATAIEYGLIAGLIFVVIVGSITALSNGNTGLFARVTDTVIPAIEGAIGGGEGDGDGEGDAP